MSQYRYLFADLLSNQVLAELPVTGVNYTQTLNAAGTASGRILLSDASVQKMNVLLSTIPERCAWYIDRDGTIVWGGIIWNRKYSSKSQTLDLTAREFESYFEYRLITQTVSWSSADQLTIAQSVVNTAQSATNGNIQVVVGTNVSGILISPTYYGYEHRTVMSVLQDLSKANNGFDFNITCAYDTSGNIIKTLNTGYPRLGKTYSATDQTASVIELGSNVVEYTYDQDGTKGANTIYAIGAGQADGQLQYIAQDLTKLTAGYPLLEKTSNYSQLNDVAILTTYANGELLGVSSPPETFQLVIPASKDPILGTYAIGDDMRVRITDPMFITGIDTIYRLTAMNITAGETAGENVTLTLTVKTI
jgi:hypothetical protein